MVDLRQTMGEAKALSRQRLGHKGMPSKKEGADSNFTSNYQGLPRSPWVQG